MDVFIIAMSALLVTGLLILWIAAARAPQGYEDDRGFHRQPDERIR